MDFRTKIKELCQLKGITQKELAAKMGISDISLNKSLRGDYPQLQTLERIANTLEVHISELFVDSNQPIYGIIVLDGVTYQIDNFEHLERFYEAYREKYH